MKRALVTGGSGDIGREICLALSEAGFDVMAPRWGTSREISKLAPSISSSPSRSMHHEILFVRIVEDHRLVVSIGQPRQ